MAKRLTETQIKEIITSFSGGKSIDALAEKFKCSKLTISRNLKKNISESSYKDLISKNKFSGQTSSNKKKNKKYNEKDSAIVGQDDYFESSSFFEITPLNEEIDKIVKQKVNEQLNQFSIIYFNKVKKNIQINEL